MNEIRFRPAELRDIAALADVKVVGWQSTYADMVEASVLEKFLDIDGQRASFRALLDDPDAVVLVAIARAEGDGESDGTGAVVGLGVGDGLTGYIDSLHVLPEHRGGRVGRRLLGVLAQALLDRGCTEVSLHVVTGNVSARRFYERLGGVLVGSAPAEWAPSVDEVHFRWTDPHQLVVDALH